MLAAVRRVLVFVVGSSLLCGLWIAARTSAQRAPTEPAEPVETVPAARRANGTATIAGTGDLLLHIKVGKAANDHDWDHVFRGLRESVQDGDVTFANLETPLVTDVIEVRTGSPPILGAPPEVAPALARAGVDVLQCANNHAYDQGAVGLSRTVTSVRAAGMLAVGADEEEAAAYRHQIVERGGLRIAFLAYSERINRGPGARRPMTYVANTRHRGDDKLLEAIATARADADVVVLGIHWSHDFVATPRIAQRRLARTWIDAGVDLILGTGAHVLQEVERFESERGEAVVAYSLGNLVSNQGMRYRVGRRVNEAIHPALRIPGTRDAILLRSEVVVEAGRIRFPHLRGVPFWVHNNFWDRVWRRASDYDIHIQRLAESPEEVRTERLAAIRETLGEHVSVEP